MPTLSRISKAKPCNSRCMFWAALHMSRREDWRYPYICRIASEAIFDSFTRPGMSRWFSGYGALISPMTMELGLPKEKHTKLRQSVGNSFRARRVGAYDS